MSKWARLAPALALSIVSTIARAESPGQSLYEEGVKAYAAGDLTAACPKFKASYEADKLAAPLFMLAKCEEKQGKIGSALIHFEEVLRLGGLEAELRDQAARSVNELATRAPKLALRRASAPAAAVATVDGAVFTIDGRPEPVDPGEHEIVVTAPGHEPSSKKLTVKEGDRVVLDIEPGKLRPAPPAPPPPRVAPPPETSDTTPLWIGGGVAAGVGAVGFVIAGVTGGLILGECEGDLACTTRDDGFESSGLVIGNYVGWGIGAAGAATGAVLFIVAAVQGGTDAPPTEASAFELTGGPSPLGLGARLAF